jgi:hypothetical protein
LSYGGQRPPLNRVIKIMTLPLVIATTLPEKAGEQLEGWQAGIVA